MKVAERQAEELAANVQPDDIGRYALPEDDHVLFT